MNLNRGLAHIAQSILGFGLSDFQLPHLELWVSYLKVSLSIFAMPFSITTFHNCNRPHANWANYQENFLFFLINFLNSLIMHLHNSLLPQSFVCGRERLPFRRQKHENNLDWKRRNRDEVEGVPVGSSCQYTSSSILNQLDFQSSETYQGCHLLQQATTEGV